MNTDRSAAHERALCQPLEVEDYGLQSMPEASPIKWHLAHTTWFFETFLLTPHLSDYRPFHPQFNFLFNSYYNAIGPRWSRPQESLLSRPTVAEITRYRAYVDEHMAQLLQRESLGKIAAAALLGFHHEQQHQELIITDLKHAWAANPLHPVYREAREQRSDSAPDGWLSFPEGIAWIGHEGSNFAFDNESPRHRVFLTGFQLASRLVTNQEFQAFRTDGGYDRPELWLSDGWAIRQANGWTAPLYWEERGENCSSLQPGSFVRFVRRSRSAMSVITKRTPMRAGPVPGCPRSLNGKPLPQKCPLWDTFWRCGFNRGRARGQ